MTKHKDYRPPRLAKAVNKAMAVRSAEQERQQAASRALQPVEFNKIDLAQFDTPLADVVPISSHPRWKKPR